MLQKWRRRGGGADQIVDADVERVREGSQGAESDVLAPSRFDLGGAIRTRAGVVRAIGVQTKAGQVLVCEAVVVPMVPSPSSAFALIPEGDERLSEIVIARQRFVQRLRDGVAGTTTAGADRSDLSLLTPREFEIVRRVVSGDRVPAIAARMFLSPSTICSHLSSVFRKFGMRSQQEIVDYFRTTDFGPEDGEGD